MSSPTNRSVARADGPALRKGLQVLMTLGTDGPLSTADVQRRTGLNKTMTFRLLQALAEGASSSRVRGPGPGRSDLGCWNWDHG